MAALVAHQKASGTSSAATDSIDTTGANLLVMVVSHIVTTTGFSISDSKSNSWSEVAYYDSLNRRVRIFYSKNPTVGTNHTFNISGTSLYGGLAILAFSGADTTSPEDVHNGTGNISASSLATGSITPSASGSIIISGVAGGGTGSPDFSINSGFSVTDSTDGTVAAAYLIQGAAAAVNPTWSWTGNADTAVIIASFKSSPETVMAAGTGSFSVSGKDAGLNVGRVLIASTGQFSLTGSAANILVEIPSLIAETGLFHLAGSSAGLSIGSVWSEVDQNITVWTPK